ncbi:L-threonate dehydrogenase [wastewater metagenome]|uniref:L-threonate dehydrogenase n=2 Tax=unclassified sequences TaxID=12908 RepID=A0A5B8RFH4_9ZZZZ|nr:L-threonate dehydrogenase [uncultured organism]
MPGVQGAEPVGVVGLGSMGLGMALALRDAGHEVIGHDPHPEACGCLADAGGRIADTPADLARQARLVVCVVATAQQVESVLFGEEGVAGVIGDDALFIQCATVPPSYIRELGTRLAGVGVTLLDAPISGGSVKAREGRLSVMASGAPAAFERGEPVLNALAETVHRLGDEVGAGSSVKLVNQLLAGVHIAAAAEAVALGLRMGLDPEVLYEVITHSAGNSWMFENRVPHILKGDYSPRSAVNIILKDLGIVSDTARECTFPAPMASAALQQFAWTSAAGLGGHDDASVIRYFERVAGVALPTAANDD